MGVRWFHVVWVAGVLVAIVVGMRRWDIEMANRKVAIVLDYSEVAHLAAAIGEQLQNVLIAFQRVGVTGVAIPEVTLSELTATGRVTTVPPALWRAINPQLPRLVSDLREHRYVMLTSVDVQLMRTLQRALRAKTKRHHAVIPVGGHSALLILRASSSALWDEGLGLDRQLIALVRDANLMVVPRLANTMALSDDWLKYIAEQLQLANARLIIFDGEEVLGYR
ncbi:MAG TPA: hypothetical protein EYP10_02945, partial [Armatimonadetes bacterium]|nr:hypothetical protein [Armatimonadota bacterium]